MSRVIFPGQRIASPGPGKGCRPINSLGSLSSCPKARTSSLKSSLRGSSNFKPIFSGKPPTLWCDFIVTEGPPLKDTLSITSGYSVPWAKNSAFSILFAYF